MRILCYMIICVFSEKKLMKDFLHFEYSSVSFESKSLYVFEHVNYVQTTACSRKV